jgi:hypothetical protein
MTRPTVSIHNTQTDEIIVREYNDEEFAQYLANKAEQESKAAADEAKAAAKAAAEAKLAALGLTTEDLKALGLGGN